MPAEWYVFKEGQELGPYSWEELLVMTRRGELKPKDLLRIGNRAEWTEAAHVEGLFSDSGASIFEESQASNSESSAPVPATSSPKPVPARNKAMPIILGLLAFLLIGGGILAFFLNLNSSDRGEETEPPVTDEDVIEKPDGEDPPFEEESPEPDPDSESAPPDPDSDPDPAPPDPDSDPDPAPPDADPADPPDGDAPDDGDRPSVVPRWDEDQPGFILPNSLDPGESSYNSTTDITFNPPGCTYESYIYIEFTFNYTTRERDGVRIIGGPCIMEQLFQV